MGNTLYFSTDDGVNGRELWALNTNGDGVVGRPSAIVTVITNDSNAAETATAGSANPGQFTLTRTGPTNARLLVNVALSGTATNGVDYTAIPSTVTFVADSATVVVTLNVIDNNLVENSEAATLTLTPGMVE